MNPSWPKWIIASISRHFNDRKGSVVLHFDDFDRRTSGLEDWAELRVNLPGIEPTNKQTEFLVEINSVVDSVQNEVDSYRHWKTAGKITRCFTNQIPVYRYGDDEDDDQTLLGCLILEGAVAVNNLGRINDEIRIYRIEVDAFYSMTLGGIQSFKRGITDRLIFRETVIGLKNP